MSEENPAPTRFRDLLTRAATPARELMDEPLPEGVSFFHTTGSLCLFMIGVQVITGILMAFYYVPSPDVAWESVRYVDERVLFGRMIHGLHHWGSSGFVVMVGIHMLRVFAFGAYKGPRKWTWVVGVGLLAVVMGFGFTGYLLPWDMKAYFGTKVGTNIMAYAPVVGPHLRQFLLGGPDIGELTLPRFYAIHTLVLPLALVGLLAAHLYLIRLYGITPPWKRDDEKVAFPLTFFPTQAVRDAFMMLIALIVLLTLASVAGGNLEEKADPASTTYAPHPEWYFLGLQQLLRYFQGPQQIIGTFVIPALAFLALLFVPFIDRNPERKLSKRPVAVLVALLSVALITGLTLQGYTQLQAERIELAKLAEKDPAEPEPEPAEALGTPVPQEAPPDAEDAAEEDISLATLANLSFLQDPGLIDFGEKLYEDLKCAKCHLGKGVGMELNVPPSLHFAGNRFQPLWLLNYMKEVPPRRYVRKARHPIARMPDFKLKPNEMRAITAYMMTFRQEERFTFDEIDFSGATAEQVAKGKELYEMDACVQCHVVGDTGAANAPALNGAGSRLQPAFIYKMIQDPQGLIPDTTMEEPFLNDEEILAVTQYLMTLR